MPQNQIARDKAFGRFFKKRGTRRVLKEAERAPSMRGLQGIATVRNSEPDPSDRMATQGNRSRKLRVYETVDRRTSWPYDLEINQLRN